MNMKTSRDSILMLTILGLVSACTPHDDVKESPTPPKADPEVVAHSDTAQPEPKPDEETVTVAVASVQLQDDCPQAERGPQGPGAAPGDTPDIAMEEGDAAAGEMLDDELANRRACVQSTVQLSIVSEDSESLPFSIRAVRLRRAEGGGSIETMSARTPKRWVQSAYAAWDESIAPGATLKVSYALGAPDWAAVERALAESSYDPLYVVELEVEVAGRLQVITSPVAPREIEEDIVT